MGRRMWALTCLLSCLSVQASVNAQGRQPTRCGAAPVVATRHQAGGSLKTAADVPERAQPCPSSHPPISDSDKALAIALLGCAVAFASHASRRRSAKVVLS